MDAIDQAAQPAPLDLTPEERELLHSVACRLVESAARSARTSIMEYRSADWQTTRWSAPSSRCANKESCEAASATLLPPHRWATLWSARQLASSAMIRGFPSSRPTSYST